MSTYVVTGGQQVRHRVVVRARLRLKLGAARRQLADALLDTRAWSGAATQPHGLIIDLVRRPAIGADAYTLRHWLHQAVGLRETRDYALIEVQLACDPDCPITVHPHLTKA